MTAAAIDHQHALTETCHFLMQVTQLLFTKIHLRKPLQGHKESIKDFDTIWRTQDEIIFLHIGLQRYLNSLKLF